MLEDNGGHSKKSTNQSYKGKDTIEELLGLDTSL